MIKKKHFTAHDKEIYRLGFVNGEAAITARHHRIIAQNRQLRRINRVLVENIRELQTYDETLKDMVCERFKYR